MASELYTSGQITFTGLGSGTDFKSMIDKLVKAERYQINRLETWKKEWDDKVTEFKQVNSKMLTLKTTLKTMDTMPKFLVKTAASSDTTILTATANSDSQSGSHSISIKQLASNDVKTNGNGYSAKDAIINSTGSTKTFSYTYDGQTHEISVSNNTTLSGLVDMINNDGSNPGVKASIISDGTSYYFQIRGMDLGSEHKITLGSGAGILPNFAASNFVTNQVASNALIKMDGFPLGSNAWLARPTNSISDVLDGVTLNLKAKPLASNASYTVSIGTDTDAIKENVRTFVEKINDVRSYILQITKFDSVKKQGSILTGNYGLQVISSQLKEITATAGIGFDSTKDTYVALSQMGILTDATEGSPTAGLLQLDEAKLDEALTGNPDKVASLFAADYVGVSDSSDYSYYSMLKGTTSAGKYTVTYTIEDGMISTAYFDGNPAKVDNDGKYITGSTGYPEAGLSIKVNNMTDGTYTGTVRIKEGKNIELINKLDELTSSTDGPLHILEDNYNDITTDIDKKISSEEKRIARMESDLKTRFAKLEALLGTYDGIQKSLEKQIASLSTKSSS